LFLFCRNSETESVEEEEEEKEEREEKGEANKGEEKNNKVEMCGCAGNEMQELQEVPELSQTLNRSHVHPVERSPVARLLAADLRATPTSNLLHKKLSQLQKEESRNGVAPSQTLLQAPHRGQKTSILCFPWPVTRSSTPLGKADLDSVYLPASRLPS